MLGLSIDSGKKNPVGLLLMMKALVNLDFALYNTSYLCRLYIFLDLWSVLGGDWGCLLMTLPHLCAVLRGFVATWGHFLTCRLPLTFWNLTLWELFQFWDLLTAGHLAALGWHVTTLFLLLTWPWHLLSLWHLLKFLPRGWPALLMLPAFVWCCRARHLHIGAWWCSLTFVWCCRAHHLHIGAWWCSLTF